METASHYQPKRINHYEQPLRLILHLQREVNHFVHSSNQREFGDIKLLIHHHFPQSRSDVAHHGAIGEKIKFELHETAILEKLTKPTEKNKAKS